MTCEERAAHLLVVVAACESDGSTGDGDGMMGKVCCVCAMLVAPPDPGKSAELSGQSNFLGMDDVRESRLAGRI